MNGDDDGGEQKEMKFCDECKSCEQICYRVDDTGRGDCFGLIKKFDKIKNPTIKDFGLIDSIRHCVIHNKSVWTMEHNGDEANYIASSLNYCLAIRLIKSRPKETKKKMKQKRAIR